MAGKDQVRFQSVMWQAMLMSAGLPATKQVVYHGFITSGGHKMSKSLGNVIDPMAIVEEYGADALRYFLARHIHPFEDSDFTVERFKEAYNADLANGLGNVVARVMKLAEDNLTEPYQVSKNALVPPGFTSALESFAFQEALERTWNRIAEIDSEITSKKPFEIVKQDLERGRAEIKILISLLWTVVIALKPFMPDTSEKIEDAIKKNKKPENLFPRKE